MRNAFYHVSLLVASYDLPKFNIAIIDGDIFRNIRSQRNDTNTNPTFLIFHERFIQLLHREQSNEVEIFCREDSTECEAGRGASREESRRVNGRKTEGRNTKNRWRRRGRESILFTRTVDAAGTRDKHRRINYARCIGRAARRTARSIQLSLFLPEFTDVSAIIEDRRAY